MAYADANNSDYGTVRSCGVAGDSIGYGPEYVFNADDTAAISAAALSSSKFVVAYEDVGNSYFGTAVIGEVSGPAVTFGPEYVFNSDETEGISVTELSSGQFVAAYRDVGNSDYGTAVIGNVSGTTISFGSEYVFNSDYTGDYTGNISATALSSTQFVVAYRDLGDFDYGTGIVGVVSGTAINYGFAYIFHEDITKCISAAALSSTKIVVAYQDTYDFPNYGKAVIGDVIVSEQPPTVTTNAATGVTNNSATLNGTLDALGTASSVDVSFQWATDSYYSSHGNTYDNETSPQAKTGTGAFSAGISGLTGSTTYHFRAKAVGDGLGCGNDKTFTATQNALTVSSTSGGSVTTPGEDVFYYDYGTVVPIIAEAVPNYQFTEWTGTAVSSGKVADPCAPSTTVTMHENYTLVANFVLQNTLTVSSTSDGSVTTPGEDVFLYDYGTVVPIIAQADLNYQLWEWTGTAVDAGKVADPCAANTTVTMHGDYTLVANFVPQQTLTISSESNGSVTTPGEGLFWYDYGQVVAIVAGPNAHYHLGQWTGTAADAGKVADPCAASTTVTMHGDYTLEANFAIDRHTLTVSSTLGGSVTTPGEGEFQYDYNDVVPIVAEPNAGYKFVEWMGTAADAGKVADAKAAGTTVTMHADYTLVANFATIIYVDANATGANNGWSWADAYNFLQDGLDAAEYGSDILVAQGTYFPDANSSEPDGTGNRKATFQLISSGGLYGGFPSGGGTWQERDHEAYETILSGDINVPGDTSDNSYYVVAASETDPITVLDGFTITAGNNNSILSWGGGMCNIKGSQRVANCKFIGNSADSTGGAIFNGGNFLSLTNCIFTGNYSGYDGAALGNLNSNAVITNCIFSGNRAMFGKGGGIYNWLGNATITNCTFSGNVAVSDGAGIHNNDCTAVIINCTLSGNTADANGGGIYNQDSDPNIINCILWGNSDVGGTDESAQIYDDAMSSSVVKYSCVQGLNIYDGNNNIGDDPNFVGEPNDGGDGWTDDPCTPGVDEGANDDYGDLHLLPESPCINAGDNNSVPADTADLDGNPRIFNSIVDMGAYEYRSAIFVDSYSTGNNDGSSWIDAYRYLQNALDAAGSGDKVWVAEGTYEPDANNTNQTGNADRAATFQLENGVAIYGGFPSGGGDWNSRNPNAYETILSGDINTPDVNTDNSYHVVTGSGTDATAVLDGFTVTAGNANGSDPNNKGGGMYNHAGSPTVVNCTFSGNSAWSWGGGMYNCYNSPTVVNCTFRSNEAGNDGGGMYNSGSDPNIINCAFSGNEAGDDGGGMSNYFGSPTVTNCAFSGNEAGDDGGGMYNEFFSSPTVTNCIFWGNGINELFPAGINVTYSNVEGGYSGIGNINADPLFVDPPDNLRLSWDSNCIDAGDNTSLPNDILDLDNDGNTVEPIPYDLDGRDRVVDGNCNELATVDIGAYEFDWVSVGDFAGGCDVDFVDFTYLALTWLKEDGDPGYDYLCDISIPADSFIDELDLSVFIDNWLEFTGPE